jgi:hypothetical protein
MKISKLALIALLGSALMAFGCSDDSSSSGTGGTAGSGGSAGGGGAGGDAGGGGAGPTCEPDAMACADGAIDPIVEDETCTLAAVPDGDVCTGDESIENPASCTATETTVSITLSEVLIPSDGEGNGMCNQGYDLDSCEGVSCNKGGLAPGEGEAGVDNALAGLAPVLVGVGGNLGGVNQAFYDGLCAGDIDITFTVDANTEENCATVTVDGGDAILMNLSADGCISGTVGMIPLNVAGIPGQMNNAVLRATLSEGGLSNGVLGATVDQATAGSIADQLIDGGAAVVAQVLDIKDDLSGDTTSGCDALSMTLQIGGAVDQ